MNAEAKPLLKLNGVSRQFNSGGEPVIALKNISLTIYPGEFVAIMGQSGSGKSTLMNIIGCLDKPSHGDYWVNGVNVRDVDADGLAKLRRETFGFIFQRYNLLATASAEENVEIPAIYAGLSKMVRSERARRLLNRLGLGGREGHRPGQLSGGQQQRVAIARALMNNPALILADEPTGALDSKSGHDVMALLQELHAEGRTVVLITHDANVAAHAERLVRIHDGEIIEDSEKSKPKEALTRAEQVPQERLPVASVVNGAPEMGEATKMALRSLRVNIFRTSLTLLGIIIGVASVVTMMAVGDGSKANVVERISSMGTDRISIRPGAPGVRSSGDNASLTAADAAALKGVDNVAAAFGERSGSFTLRRSNMDFATSVTGVGAAFPQANNWALAEGTFFNERDNDTYAPVIVLGKTVRDSLFTADEDPIGAYILVGSIPFEVIGVLEPKGAGFMGDDQDNMALVPLNTGLVRLFGGQYVRGITVVVADTSVMSQTEQDLRNVLLERHRKEDFSIRNMSSLLETVSATQDTLTILLGTVAAISLLVGGIGVMNIMLVSVTERTREIGIRMATGARRRDILLQFITEAAVVCTLGGVIGVSLGMALSGALAWFGVNILINPAPALIAFVCAIATGLVFGFLPARKAANLDPVVALASE